MAIRHDQVLDVPTDAGLDDRQASIALKTRLHRVLDDPGVVRCYLDSDMIAVKRTVDSVFDFLTGKVAFANDHSELSEFSRRAVHCGCRTRRCRHLQQAVQETFGVTIDRPNWRQWNGGLFVFDEASIPLLERWHEFTLRILDHPYWRTRDQGTLAAAVWDQSLQDDPVLPREFNTIVDCFRGIPEHLRPTAPPSSFAVDRSVPSDSRPRDGSDVPPLHQRRRHAPRMEEPGRTGEPAPPGTSRRGRRTGMARGGISRPGPGTESS